MFMPPAMIKNEIAGFENDDRGLIAGSATGSNESVACMGLLSVLLAWHEQDPVTEDERIRNDVVYSYQGNRNPFVDHPEWVACVFSGICGGSSCTVLFDLWGTAQASDCTSVAYSVLDFVAVACGHRGKRAQKSWFGGPGWSWVIEEKVPGVWAPGRG